MHEQHGAFTTWRGWRPSLEGTRAQEWGQAGGREWGKKGVWQEGRRGQRKGNEREKKETESGHAGEARTGQVACMPPGVHWGSKSSYSICETQKLTVSECVWWQLSECINSLIDTRWHPDLGTTSPHALGFCRPRKGISFWCKDSQTLLLICTCSLNGLGFCVVLGWKASLHHPAWREHLGQLPGPGCSAAVQLLPGLVVVPDFFSLKVRGRSASCLLLVSGSSLEGFVGLGAWALLPVPCWMCPPLRPYSGTEVMKPQRLKLWVNGNLQSTHGRL